jgi:hypothetical protein
VRLTRIDARRSPSTVAAGALVPHAPALLPSLSGGAPDAAARVRDAIEDLSWGAVSVLVVLSPHGFETGIYRAAEGSLDGFGVTGVTASFEGDGRVARALTRAWGRPLLDAPLDYGALVPLLLLRPDVPVIAATLGESARGAGGTLGELAADAGAFVDALDEAIPGAGLVASCNTGAGLNPRAPLTEVPEALVLETKLLEGLASDASVARELAVDLGVAGSCATGSLAAFGRAFGGAPARVVGYECPFGVGYPVVAGGRA